MGHRLEQASQAAGQALVDAVIVTPGRHRLYEADDTPTTTMPALSLGSPPLDLSRPEPGLVPVSRWDGAERSDGYTQVGAVPGWTAMLTPGHPALWYTAGDVDLLVHVLFRAAHIARQPDTTYRTGR